MRARRLSNRVQIWQTESVSDGFGGNTNKDYQLTDSWAEVKTLGNSSKYSKSVENFGLTDRFNSIVVTMRKRNDIEYNSINQYLVFKGVEYIIQSQPANVDFRDDSIVLIATRQSIKEVPNLDPIGRELLFIRIKTEYALRVANDGGVIEDETCLNEYIYDLLGTMSNERLATIITDAYAFRTTIKNSGVIEDKPCVYDYVLNML